MEDPAVLYSYGGRVFGLEHQAETRRIYDEALTESLTRWRAEYPDVKVITEVLTGVPAKLLVEATRQVDVVVIGGRPRGDGEDGMRIGAIAHTLLHHAVCPVAVVPDR